MGKSSNRRGRKLLLRRVSQRICPKASISTKREFASAPGTKSDSACECGVNLFSTLQSSATYTQEIAVLELGCALLVPLICGLFLSSVADVNLFRAAMVTTPPIPPSSPGNETMEISPLPHKAAYKRMPFTPDYGGRDRGMRLCSSPPTGSPVRKPLGRPKLVEYGIICRSGQGNVLTDVRRKISRPSLLRQGSRMSGNSASFKTQSSGSISFGRSPATPQVNLEELFSGGASPEGKRIGSAAGFLGPPPSKPFAIANAGGSPVAPPARQCRPAARPKGKIRRTMSMFEHPQEVVHHVANGELNTSPKTGAGENTVIPSFNVKDDPLRRINRATLISIMDGEYKEHFDEYKIIDCRFEYEFEGGHIAGATNINSVDILEETFFAESQEDKRQLIIFHCEYSAHRAPRM